MPDDDEDFWVAASRGAALAARRKREVRKQSDGWRRNVQVAVVLAVALVAWFMAR